MLTESDVWKSNVIMAANCEAELDMLTLMKLVRAIEAEVRAEAQEPRLTTKQQFDSLMDCSQETPIERLRFFCSLAMNGQDWLDVEPFFDALTAAQPPAPCPSCADSSAEAETYKTQWAISCAERDALQTKVAEIEESARKSALNVGNWHRQFMKTMETVAEQYTLIEQCEQALEHPEYTSQGLARRRAEALAAIATHKKGIAK